MYFYFYTMYTHADEKWRKGRVCPIELMCTWHETTIRIRQMCIGAQEVYKYIYALFT